MAVHKWRNSMEWPHLGLAENAKISLGCKVDAGSPFGRYSMSKKIVVYSQPG